MNLSNLWTESDNKTLCPVRGFGILIGLQFIGNVQYMACKSGVFDAQHYGLAAAAVVTAIGAAVSFKASQEGKAG